ncbi:MAG TPA: ABC transporter permease [Nitrososphaerales archaeon]|nr:ABC transporter permease [Nitrososphaerales archaeon]
MRRGRFSFGRSLAVAWRVLSQIRRDRRTLGMLFAMPAIVMLIFGFALGGQASNVPVLVDNQDAGYSVTLGPAAVSLHAGSHILASLQSDSAVSVTTGSFTSGKTGVDSGTYFAAILIPSNFSQTVFMRAQGRNVTASIQIYIDGTKPSIAAGVLGALQGAVQNASGIKGFSLVQQYAYGGVKFSGLDVSLPSVTAFVLTFLVLLISLLTVSRETTSGTLPRLYTTPLTAIERLLGYTLSLLVVGIMMVAVVLVVGIGLFGAVVRGDPVLLFAAAVLYTLSQVLLAVFLSNFARNEFQAVQLAPLIGFPSMALSGMLVPISSLPSWIQPISRLIPMYYANQLFEGIMLKGYDVGNLAFDFLVVIVMAALFLVLAMTTVKDQIDA